jgi:hypothetical protein
MPRQKTIIEGVVYYDVEKISYKSSDRKERNELVNTTRKNKG